MIRCFTSICTLLLLSSFSSPSLRHTQSFQGLEFVCGTSTLAPLASVAYSYYLARRSYLKLALTYERTTRDGIAFQALHLEPAIAYSLTQYRSTCYLNLLATLSATFEQHQDVGRRFQHQGGNLALGIGSELELFLSNQLILLLTLLPYYYFFESPYGRIGYGLTTGLKLSF
ncbi:MAG: hypothetical protein ROO73_05085 [Roseivirga sp.]